MRCYLLLFAFCATFSFAFAQADPPNVKSEHDFKKAFKERDYEKARVLIENALEKTPDDPELLYFMAYTLDRLNNYESKDPKLYHDLTLQASAYLERLFKISPDYKGEQLILDPYEKMTAIWGSQAMHFLVYGQADSANWCFEQGRLRGGFIDAQVQLAKHILDSCEENAVLLSSGDMMTFTLMYAQHYLKHRTDLLVFDINVINTDWYTEYIQNEFDHPALKLIDLTSYLINDRFDERPIIIETPNCEELGVFEWSFKAPYPEEQFLRSHLVFIDLIRKVHAQYPIRFTPGLPPSQTLGMIYQIVYSDLAGRLNLCTNDDVALASQISKLDIKGLDDPTIQRSSGTIGLLQFYRMAYLHQIDYFYDKGNPQKARSLFQEMQTRIPEETVPQVYESIEFLVREWEETFGQ